MDLKAPCVHCRTPVTVPASYADGDHIKCGACDTQHRVLRVKDSVRLVIADVGPLKDALHANEHRLKGLEQELAQARASFGIGINGALIGLLYVVAKVGLEEQMLDTPLIMTAAVLSLVTGILLELANLLFLQKRKAMAQISDDIAQLSLESKDLQRKIREATVRR